MANETMNEDFPDNEQRAAVCYRQFRGADAKEQLQAVCEATIRAAEGKERQPRFNITAYNGGKIRPESPMLDAPIVIDLASASSPNRIAANLNHDYTQIVGQTTKVEIGESEVTMEGRITGDWKRQGEPAEQVMMHSRNGFVWPVSLGGAIDTMDYIDKGESETVNGSEVEGPVYVARNVRLKHIAFLSDPADQTAAASIAAKSKQRQEIDMDFEKWLRALGFDPADLTEDQKTALEAKFKAEQEDLAAKSAKKPAKPKKQKSYDKKLAELKLARKREEEIGDLALRYGRDYPSMDLDRMEELRAEAIDDETITAADFETTLLRECSRYQYIDPTARPGRRDERIRDTVMVAALCKLGGLRQDTLEKQFSADVLDEADRRWKYGLSLRELLELTARAHGMSAGNFRSHPGDVMFAAMPPKDKLHAATGASMYDVSGILGDALHRFIVDYFMGVDLSAMRTITSTRSVADFRQIESYSLTGDLTYELVEPGGEIKHGTFGETPYVNKADTYGKMLAIDRRDLVNDDLNALSRIAQRLGRGGALALGDVFWKKWVDNSTFFTVGNNNLITPVLTIDGLSAAKTAFNKQVDPDGRPLNVSPSILLVPPELDATARTILNSQIVVMAGGTDPNEVRGNTNVHSGTLSLAVSRELSNDTYTGYSETAWFVLAAPGTLPTVETCFLNGRQMPVIESMQADFETLGIKLRGYFDFGVEMHEYRGGIKSSGTV